MSDTYFERDGVRMPPEADLEPGDVVVIPRDVVEGATDGGRYVGDMSLWIAAVQRGCVVQDLDDGPNGEFRRLITPDTD
jgi:hypothetical protein